MVTDGAVVCETLCGTPQWPEHAEIKVVGICRKVSHELQCIRRSYGHSMMPSQANGSTMIQRTGLAVPFRGSGLGLVCLSLLRHSSRYLKRTTSVDTSPSGPHKHRMEVRRLRRKFLKDLSTGLMVVWPILSGLLGWVIALGMIAGWIEGWSLHESIYFAFVSGLTIGYGDLAPKTQVARTLAIMIGFCGVLFTALAAAVAVKALSMRPDSDPD